MTWTWQLPNWPQFTFDPSRFTHIEREFHRNVGVIIGSLTAVAADEVNELRVTLLSNEALDTSKIEGEFLDRDSVQSSIRRQLGLQTDARRAGPKETEIAQMMVDLVRSGQEPLTREHLFSWHQRVLNGRIDLETIGGYRTHADPMQIVSGRLDRPNVYYEAPPPGRVAEEMNQYIDWFNRAADAQLPTVVHAGIAHLYFELIHPFEDGNGRIGRTIAEKALAIGARQSLITALSSTIERDKKAYYQALERATTSLDITEWLVYFSEKILEAQVDVQKTIAFMIYKARYLETYRSQLNRSAEQSSVPFV